MLRLFFLFIEGEGEPQHTASKQLIQCGVVVIQTKRARRKKNLNENGQYHHQQLLYNVSSIISSKNGIILIIISYNNLHHHLHHNINFVPRIGSKLFKCLPVPNLSNIPKDCHEEGRDKTTETPTDHCQTLTNLLSPHHLKSGIAEIFLLAHRGRDVWRGNNWNKARGRDIIIIHARV